MAAMRGRQVQGQHVGEIECYHVLHWVHREAGVKMRGVAAERTSREPI